MKKVEETLAFLMVTIIGAACLASGAVAATRGDGDPNYMKPIPAEVMTRYYPCGPPS